MIKSLTFTNRFGRSLHCNLFEPEHSNIAITNIDGLGPGKSNVTVNDIATSDGGIFSSARMSFRNIVFTFYFIDHDSEGNYVRVEDVRRLSYEFFMPKTKIRVVVETDHGKNYVIYGYVEYNEPTIFSKQSSSSVSLICPDYYFKMIGDTGDLQTAMLLGSGSFEFPFSNESLSRKMIEFSVIEAAHEYDLYYDGDSENGFELEIMFLGDSVSYVTISNEPIGNSEQGNVGFDEFINYPAWHDLELTSYIQIYLSDIEEILSEIYTSDPIYAAGNKIIISTLTGKKSVTFVTYGGDEYNILDGIRHIDWIKLYPGYNHFTIATDNASAGRFRVEAHFNTLYSGV